MKNFFRLICASFCLAVLCLPAEAADITAKSSTHLFSAGSTSYAAESVIDGDPSTAWIEGVAGAGTGQWLLIEFPSEAVVGKIGITNGYQKNGSFNRHNKIKRASLVYSDGSSQEIELKDEMGVQYVQALSVPTTSIKLVIREIHPARELRFRGDTALSEIELKFDRSPAAPAEIVEAKTAPTAVAEEFKDDSVDGVTPPPTATNLMVNVDKKPVKSVAIAEDVSDASKVAEKLEFPASPKVEAKQAPKELKPAAPVAEGQKEATVVPPFFQEASKDASSRPAPVQKPVADPKPQAAAPAPAVDDNPVLKRLQEKFDKGVVPDTQAVRTQPQPEPKAAASVPETKALVDDSTLKRLQEQFDRDQAAMNADPAAELVYMVKLYYQRMYTLDDKYDELFAESVREQEGLIFEVFRETQRKRGVYDLFREALVDLKKLDIEATDIDRDLAEVQAKGMFTLYLADDYNDYPEETKFVFKRERDQWKILDIK